MLLEVHGLHYVFERIGWTPLHAAIEQEHIESVQLFAGFAKKKSQTCSFVEESGNRLRGFPLLDQPSAKLGEQQKMQESLQPRDSTLHHRLRA